MRCFARRAPIALSLLVSCQTGVSTDKMSVGDFDPGGLATFAPTCDGGSCASPASQKRAAPACGDGLLTEGEACDDRNVSDGDGCSADCRSVEPGWRCPIVGTRCEALACGDGLLVGTEECEFQGAPPVGCSASCRILPGYDCDAATQACAPVVCGDGKVSRGESCEDGNELPFDGCYQCQKEPSCSNGHCAPACGDGQRFAEEACDDGNTRSGDGCSSTCTVETGFICRDILAEPPLTLSLPVIVRDFIGRDNQLGLATYHEDFNRHGGAGVLGIVEQALGNDGKPVYACPGGDCGRNPGHLYLDGNSRPNTSTRENFDQWYRDVPGINVTSVVTLSLARKPNGTYSWDSADPASNQGLDYFDPVGVGGWVGLGKERRSSECSPARNSSFSSETHFWFQYQGGERFDFSGDDDTWIYLNRKLAIDLGGLHTPRSGYFILDGDADGSGPDKADGTAQTWSEIEAVVNRANFGLVRGGVYEVVMFQAERNQCGSNFKVTLKNFNRPKSSCGSWCGDGAIANDEACDDGKNDGSYGGCMPGCKQYGPFCGDGLLDRAHEACDDGNTNDADACTNGCAWRDVR